MRKIFIITLLCISIQTFGQQNREIGLNLRTSAYQFMSPLFTDFNSGIGVEVFYKKHKLEKTNRFSVAIGVIPPGGWDWDTIYERSIDVNQVMGTVTNHFTKGSLILKKGYEEVFKKEKFDFYVGADLGLTLFYAKSSIDIMSSSHGVLQMEDRNTWSGNLILYPFAGVRIPIKKRFYFTTELTLPIGGQIQNRHFSGGQGNWLLDRETSIVYPRYWIDFIGNIGFSCQF